MFSLSLFLSFFLSHSQTRKKKKYWIFLWFFWMTSRLLGRSLFRWFSPTILYSQWCRVIYCDSFFFDIYIHTNLWPLPLLFLFFTPFFSCNVVVKWWQTKKYLTSTNPLPTTHFAPSPALPPAPPTTSRQQTLKWFEKLTKKLRNAFSEK